MLTLILLVQALVPDPEGVFVDPDGVLKNREQVTSKRLTELRKRAATLPKEENRVYLSVPRLLSEARALIEAGKPLPDNIRYLGGMVKLQYVFVYADDLVIAGRAELFDTSVPFRPLGQRTGRPVLHLEDLVTALRTCGPGKADAAFGCTINLSQEVVDRVRARRKELEAEAKKSDRRRYVADEMAKAGGTQELQFYNVAPDTRFAFVCAEADYVLKRLVLGLEKSLLVKSYLALQETPDKAHRFWLETRYDTLAVADGAYELRGPSVRINTRRTFTEADDTPSDVAKQFTDAASKNYTKLSESILPFADLANVTDLALLAALIDADKLDAGIAWALKDYPVARMDVPKSAQTLVNYHAATHQIIFTSGGVRLGFEEALKARTTDDVIKNEARRPDESILLRKMP